MKKGPLMLITLFYSVLGCSQTNFKINGTVDFKEAGLKLFFSDNRVIETQISPDKNSFKINGLLYEPYEFVSLALFKRDTYITEWKFFISPGKAKIAIELDTTLKKYKLSSENLPFFNKQVMYDHLVEEDHKKQRIITTTISRKEKLTSYEIDSLNTILKRINDTAVYNKLSFIDTETNSFLGLFLFKRDIVNNLNSQIRISPDSMNGLFNRFTPELKSTREGKWVEEELTKRRRLVVGRNMPEFSFMDSSFNKHSLVGNNIQKYILLCFWDAGCKPCIASFPILKSLYTQHRGSLEIISVSLDSDEKRWKSALMKYNLPWPNTCNIKKYADTDIASLYNVQYIPQYFLINKSGELVYHNVLSEDNDSYDKLMAIIRNSQ